MPQRLFHVERNPGGVIEKWYSDEQGNITRAIEQDHTRVIDAVHNVARDGGARGANMHYMGSIPTSVAAQWSRICGARVGSREFAEFARKQLLSGEYSKLATGLH